MYEFLLRAHSQDLFQEDMRAIFGEIPETDGRSPEEKEEYLVKLYLKRLKEIVPARGGKPRVVSVPVLEPTIDRTLYHLIYLTRHAKGITVFMEASEKLDLVQRRTRAQAKQKNAKTKAANLNFFRPPIGCRWKSMLIQPKSNCSGLTG